MKKNTYLLNTILAALLGTVLLIAILFRTFLPRIILMELDIPNMALISLVTLLADHYLAPESKRCYICIPVFSAISFGLLPYAGHFVSVLEALKMGVVGGTVFTVMTWLFSSVQDRLSTGPEAKAAPVVNALCLYLTIQGLMGVIF